MVSPSRCPPWQPERPGPTRREPRRAQRSYTTRRDTIVGKDDFNAARVAAVPQMLGRWASNAAPDSPKFNRCSHKHRTRSKTKRHQAATGWRAAISPNPDNAQGSLQKLTKQSVNNIGSPPHRATNLLRPPVSRSQDLGRKLFFKPFPGGEVVPRPFCPHRSACIRSIRASADF